MKLVVLAVLLLTAAADVRAQPSSCLDRVPRYDAAPPLLSGDTLHLQGRGELFYIGVPNHTSDPDDPFFGRLDSLAARFRPTVVFFEGPDRGVHSTREATIRMLGESGYARFLAAQMGASTAGLEPPPPADFAAVAETVGAEKAALFFVLRETARLRDRRGLAGDSLRAAIAALLEKAAPMGLPITTTERLDVLTRAHVDATLDWTAVPGAWFDPLRFDDQAHFFPTANRASSHFRNQHMAQVLATAVGNGERVLAIVGRHHLPMQSDALHCLLAR